MITRDAVTWGYRLILGREPESESVVDAHASIKDIETFRKVLFNSIEFARSNLTARLPSRWVAAPVMDGRRLIWVDLSDSFVSRGCLFDNYEPEETRFVRNFLKQGDTFVDIGANIGWFTLVASTMVGDCGTIHAFEPRAITGDYLERSIEINGLHKQVRVHRYGLSDAEGHAYLTWAQNTANPGGSFLSADASRAGMEYQSVRLQALDHLGLERVDFMKVDVEGQRCASFEERAPRLRGPDLSFFLNCPLRC